MPDRALRMGNTCGLSRGSRGTALISHPWEEALSRHPVARPLSPARLRRVLNPCFANARFVYLCNPYATKGVFAAESTMISTKIAISLSSPAFHPSIMTGISLHLNPYYCSYQVLIHAIPGLPPLPHWKGPDNQRLLLLLPERCPWLHQFRPTLS